MKGKSPIITLIVGLVFAAVVVVANLDAAKGSGGGKGNPYGAGAVGDVKPSSHTSTPANPSTSPPPAAPATSPPAAPIARATYAGYTTGSGISIAIAIHDGVAVAYLCSGTIESWLQGRAEVNGTLKLTGTHK